MFPAILQQVSGTLNIMGNGFKLAEELASALSLVTGLSSSLTSTYKALEGVATKIEKRFEDLTSFEEMLANRKEILDSTLKDIEAREEAWKNKEAEMQQKAKECKETIDKWNVIQARINASTTYVSESVALNVGMYTIYPHFSLDYTHAV